MQHSRCRKFLLKKKDNDRGRNCQVRIPSSVLYWSTSTRKHTATIACSQLIQIAEELMVMMVPSVLQQHKSHLPPELIVTSTPVQRSARSGVDSDS